jgi:hypothetical protein
MRRLIVLATFIVAALGLASFATAASPNTTSNSLSYEFDNGSAWTLQQNTAALNATIPDLGYADAGIVVDLGLADSFTGITYGGTGTLSVNVWIGDGSQAYTPGTHLFTDGPANFSYGFQQSNGSFWMTTGPYAGQTLTPAQIATDFPGFEVYAWVGVVYGGSTVSGSVTSVNGDSVGNRSMSITKNGDTTVTAVIH